MRRALASRPHAHRAVVVAALVLLAAAQAAAAGDRVVFDQLLTVSMGGQEVGTVAAKDTATKDGFRFERRSALKIQRGAQYNEVVSVSTSTTNKDLQPIEYRYERTDAGGTLKAVGKVKGGVLVLTTTQSGGTNTVEQPLPKGATFATALEHMVRSSLKDGLRVERAVVLEELGAVAQMTVDAKKTATGFRVTSSLQGLVTEEDVDAQGRTVVARTPAVGIVAYPPGRAPQDVGQGQSADLLARSTWPAPRLADGTTRVRYRVTTPDAATFAIPEDARQRVVARDAGAIVVEVVAGPSTRGPLSAAERAKRTAATPYEPIGDKRLVEAARAATQGAKTTREKAAKLATWVHQHVDQKGLDRGYAPALATLLSRAGDCTEHSVLYSALARALGIPTRLVDGVVVDGGRAGYHEWVEVQIDDEGFVPADPTFGEFPASPARLKLAEGSTSPDEQLQLSLAASRLLKPGVKIEIVDATPPAK